MQTHIRPGRAARDLFLEAVEAFLRRRPGQELPVIEHNGEAFTLAQACGFVWNCADAFPSGWEELRDHFEFKQWTYAAVARGMHNHLED
ncbi:MAG: hypothetical protein H6874_09380 [Hyphomicrobiaceae bacterium]|nr:hypothetical protein [Hyphomicrobiaceae bacterium]